MDHEARARLIWVEMYLATGDAALTCRRCGISYPTLRKWVRRYQQEGVTGLQSRSRRPKGSPRKKVTEREASWILGLHPVGGLSRSFDAREGSSERLGKLKPYPIASWLQ